MTLTLTLGHVVALGVGAIVAAILMGVLSSARVQEASARAKIQEARATCHGLRLTEFQAHHHALKVHHREMFDLQHQIHAHLKKRESDARTIANLQKAFNEQLHDEIRLLNQALGKIPELHGELADWAAFGLRLRASMDCGDRPVIDLEWTEDELNRLLAERDDRPVITSIEEIPRDEEAGSGEEETTERAAVGA